MIDAAVWRALADPTRRRILDELRASPLPTGRLASRFDMTRFGVMKHLRVLGEAGLVLVEPRGRERWHHLNPVPLREIYHRWMRSFEEQDADRLLRIRELAERSAKESTMSATETPTAATVRTIHVEVLVQAPLEHVWKTMVVETGEWWHKDFYTGPSPVGFHIEPKLGGRMYEDWGEGQGQIWGSVTGVRAPAFLQIVGDSSKAWGGPHRSVMTYELDEVDEGGKEPTTRLRLEHSIFGHVSESTEESLAAGWKQLFEDCMKHYAETGSRREGT